MGWSKYQLPTPWLVEQGLLTGVDLRRAVAGRDREPWARAGLDVDAHRRAVDEVTEGLWAAWSEALLARAELHVTRAEAAEPVARAHGWLLWLAGVVADVRRAGRTSAVRLSSRDLLRHAPPLRGTLERLRKILPDVATDRAILAAVTTAPERLDEGAAWLAALEVAVAAERAAAEATAAAAAREDAWRSRYAAVFRALDRDAARITSLERRRPLGGDRDVLYREVRRRTGPAGAARRRRPRRGPSRPRRAPGRGRPWTPERRAGDEARPRARPGRRVRTGRRRRRIGRRGRAGEEARPPGRGGAAARARTALGHRGPGRRRARGGGGSGLSGCAPDTPGVIPPRAGRVGPRPDTVIVTAGTWRR